MHNICCTLGADGVLLASFIAKAKEPEKATREIVDGLGGQYGPLLGHFTSHC